MDLVKKIFNKKKFILKITLFFFLVGLSISLMIPKEFTAVSTFLPQTSESKSESNLSGLASLAGINLGGASSGGEIPPTLYPQILNSVPVKRLILNINVPYNNIEISYSEYLLNQPKPIYSILKKYTIGLPSFIINSIFDEEKLILDKTNPMLVSNDEKLLFEILDKQISILINEKQGFVQLSVIANNATVAAILTSKIQEILQERIIDYKIQHANEYKNFTQRQYLDKQKDYYRLLNEVAISKDQNINISSERYQIQLKQKEGELIIAQSVYQELAKQLEQAKLQVAKNTPIFSTIKPVIIPTEKSAPKIGLILILFIFSGFLISMVIILIKEPLLKTWDQIQE